MNDAFRPYVTAGVVLVGAGIICMGAGRAPVLATHARDVQLTVGEEQITLDLVRHGETVGSNSRRSSAATRRRSGTRFRPVSKASTRRCSSSPKR
jgi:hypothetical protein